jgi:hypothetical protein
VGARAQNLKEFRDGLLFVNPRSIYHHFWERLLRPQFAEPEYNNDFASWAYHALHEKALAERLSIVDPTDFSDLESLRHEVVEIVEQRLDETEIAPWARLDQQFYFLESKTVIFDTGLRLDEPEALADVAPRLSASSVYYHFIDARRRTPDRTDDFTAWLRGCGEPYEALALEVADFDPYFSSLERIRDSLASLFARHLGPSSYEPSESRC